MSQHDMTLDNASGLVFRNDANAALQALASQSSGASAPSPTFPCQVWGDTGTGRLKQRNSANSAWLDMGPLDAPLRDAASQGEYATDTGAAGAYVCNFTPAITVRNESTPIRFKAANANPGACTINDGLGTVALVGGAHSALQGNEIIANGIAWIQWNASVGGGSYVLLFCTGAPQQVAPATKSQQAVQFGQLFGGLKGLSRFTSSGSFTVPAGVTQIYVSGCAGGGGGGGTFNIGATGNISAGGGGGGAGQSIIRQAYAVTPGQVIAITIGSGGTGAAIAGSGGAGGATLVGALVTLTGGGGGAAGGAGPFSSSYAGGAGGSGYPQGSDGPDCTTAITSTSGMGASCPFGGGGAGRRGLPNNSLAGVAGGGYGSGGSGASGAYAGSATSSGNVGGAGAPGLVVIEW
ncbi:hypothetical protein PMI21_05462 [Pseudomonas sp. GM18]|uniref:glycine-rich domain-containing protein n=1 Tax=Pseudomonas sp. GM18 TaxID=1144324 RepID=UPI00027243C9|nr:hypothetical protein PMI21_05462 [Pseudomonas sp. GM18]